MKYKEILKLYKYYEKNGKINKDNTKKILNILRINFDGFLFEENYSYEEFINILEKLTKDKYKPNLVTKDNFVAKLKNKYGDDVANYISNEIFKDNKKMPVDELNLKF